MFKTITKKNLETFEISKHLLYEGNKFCLITKYGSNNKKGYLRDIEDLFILLMYGMATIFIFFPMQLIRIPLSFIPRIRIKRGDKYGNEKRDY